MKPTLDSPRAPYVPHVEVLVEDSTSATEQGQSPAMIASTAAPTNAEGKQTLQETSSSSPVATMQVLGNSGASVILPPKGHKADAKSSPRGEPPTQQPTSIFMNPKEERSRARFLNGFGPQQTKSRNSVSAGSSGRRKTRNFTNGVNDKIRDNTDLTERRDALKQSGNPSSQQKETTTPVRTSTRHYRSPSSPSLDTPAADAIHKNKRVKLNAYAPPPYSYYTRVLGETDSTSKGEVDYSADSEDAALLGATYTQVGGEEMGTDALSSDGQRTSGTSVAEAGAKKTQATTAASVGFSNDDSVSFVASQDHPSGPEAKQRESGSSSFHPSIEQDSRSAGARGRHNGAVATCDRGATLQGGMAMRNRRWQQRDLSPSGNHDGTIFAILPPNGVSGDAGNDSSSCCCSSGDEPPSMSSAVRKGFTPATSRPLPPSVGVLMNELRYSLPPCPPYRIPLYDQVCAKYIFNNMFDTQFQIMELFFVFQNVIVVLVNVVMTIINVFFNDLSPGLLPFLKVSTVVVFSLEMGVVLALFIFMIIVLLCGVIKDEMSTKLAQDVAELSTLAGTFSMLRVVGLASPSFAFRRILPIFQNAIGIMDIAKGTFLVLLWVVACLLAFFALIVKVTQIDFAFTVTITDWTILQLIQLIGLLMNLARVDDSYYKETSVLLDAVHRHFSPPGNPHENDPPEKSTPLYSSLLAMFGMRSYMCYEYFDTIFNYHINPEFVPCIRHDVPRCTHVDCAGNGRLSRWTKMRRMINYIAFLFEIDTVQLRRYLQMTQSPLPFYRVGRESFMAAFMERDLVGMDVAVWRSDPIASATRKYAEVAPGQFDIAFECEDRRDIWDPDYNAFMEQAEKARAGEMANVLAKRHSRRPASSLRHSHSNAGAQSLHAQERRSAKPKAR